MLKLRSLIGLVVLTAVTGLLGVMPSAAARSLPASLPQGAAGTAFTSQGQLKQNSLAAGTVILVSGTIGSDTTWTTGNTYQVSNLVTVNAGVTLTIQPGVQVEFQGSGSALKVLGTLSANGADGNPITFTCAIKDQASCGGIIIGDSALSAPITGSTLSYVVVEYGGYPASGNIQLYQARATIDHATIRYGGGAGVYAGDANSWADISNTSFDHNSGYAIELRNAAANPVFANLTAANNGYNKSAGTSNPAYDAIKVWGGTMTGAHVWEAAGLPYEYSGATVAAGGQLTVQPGVEVRFTGGGLDVQGKITAVGTSGKPILFTSVNKTPGDWVGATVEGTSAAFNSGSTFAYVTMEYGAYPNGDGDLNLYYASATITHSTFRNSAEWGIATANGAWVDVSDSTFAGNTKGAMYFRDPSVNQKWANLTISGNGSSNDKNFVELGAGTITGSVEWLVPAAGIPYVVDGGINVASGGVLTVDPGVEARFVGYWLAAVDDGQLIADGTPQQPITLTVVTKTPGAWGGVQFNGSADKPNYNSRLRYVTVEYGDDDVHMENAYPFISHCTLRHSQEYGVYGRIVAGPRIFDTTIEDSGDYAIYIHEVNYKPQFDHLTATNNGPSNDKNVLAFGGGTLAGEALWPNAGLPYVMLGDVTVAAGGTLTLDPGVEVRFDQGRGFDIRGKLLALGTQAQPITLTGTTADPAWWCGVHIEGYSDAPSTGSKLDYTTVEYGGCNSANVSTSWGQISIQHSLLRHSARDGLYTQAGGDLVSIGSSQIVQNAGYGVRNADYQHSIISAANNWWGDPSGPRLDGACSTGGTGSVVSAGVDFAPILTSSTGEANPLSPSTLYNLTIEPDRWYVPADGVMVSTIKATLRDGAGNPVSGRTVLASTTLGSVEAGGITGPTGSAIILVKSSSAGDATVTARIDQPDNPCDLIRPASVEITFTPFAASQASLTPNSGSPYTSADIEFGPQPLVRGTPATVTVRVTNPYDHPILVNAVLGIAQSGIGLTFGPIQQWEDVPLAAHEVKTLSATYTPVVAGHWCFHLDYSWQEPGGAASVNAASAEQTLNIAQDSGSSSTGKNTSSQPASTNSQKLNETLGMQNKKVNWQNFGEQTTPPSDSDNNNPTKKDINRRISDAIPVTRQIGHAMQGDPPSQDYRTIVQPVKPIMPIYSTGVDGLTDEQASAANALLDALADAIANGRAVLGSDDRYAGATEAGDETWAAQQTAAVLYYKQLTGLAYLKVADDLQQWLNVYPGDRIPSVADVLALQQRLRSSGFTAEELASYKALGATDADIEWIKQSFLARDPAELAISVRVEYADDIVDYRELGNLLAYPPATFSQQIESAASVKGAGASSAANLAGIHDVEQVIEVGNPLQASTAVDLKVRRISMPADWGVQVSPSSLTLEPGHSQPVTVTVSPGTTSVQGMTARVAIEGYAGNQLLGGVEVQVVVPRYASWPPRRPVYVPLVRK